MTILLGDCREILPTLDAGSVRCCVTSPPYWGLRDYGTATWEGGSEECSHSVGGQVQDTKAPGAITTGQRPGVDASACRICGARRIDSQLGLEKTPEEYVAAMVGVFREVRRVLADDATLWLNLGDSYAAARGGTTPPAETLGGGVNGWMPDGARTNRDRKDGYNPSRNAQAIGLKHKDLVGIPWRVAFALQADGWTLRSEIIWKKPNPMPESVTDRPTKSHEQVFLFAKAKWVGPERRRFADIPDQDARWLALFLDTEGNVCIKRVQREDGRTQYGAQVAFANTSRALLETAQRIVGKGTILERAGKNAPMFYYQLAGQEAGDLLHRLYPFLIVKPRQAALGIHVQEMLAPSGKTRPGGFRHPDLTRSLEAAWAAMKSLNHFGSPDLSGVPVPSYGHWDSARYYYDAGAIAEPVTDDMAWRAERGYTRGGNGKLDASRCDADTLRGEHAKEILCGTRNSRSVWTIPTQPTPEAHFATFPEALAERCILAGSTGGDIVLDPFFGSGTVGRVAERLGRKWIGIELNEKYVEIARKRTAQIGLYTSDATLALPT